MINEHFVTSLDCLRNARSPSGKSIYHSAEVSAEMTTFLGPFGVGQVDLGDSGSNPILTIRIDRSPREGASWDDQGGRLKVNGTPATPLGKEKHPVRERNQLKDVEGRR
jgi:hypothetical protein